MLAAGLAAVLIYATSGWLIALPLVLFEYVPPSKALRISRDRTRGSRWSLLFAIATWAIAMTLLSGLLTGLVIMIGREIVSRAGLSLGLLTVAIGISLVVSAAVNLLVNLLATTTFASLLFHSYRLLGNPQADRITKIWELSSSRSRKGIRNHQDADCCDDRRRDAGRRLGWILDRQRHSARQ